MAKQSYHVWNDYKGLDTDSICNLIYQVKNESSNSQVVMFTEDDVNSLPLDKLIFRKICQKIGDVSLSLFIWDDVAVDYRTPHVPDLFVKILPPNESFDIIFLLQDEDDSVVDSLFRHHLLLCSLEDVEKVTGNFEDALKYHHLLYPASSIALLWSQFADSMKFSEFKRKNWRMLQENYKNN